jgi:hypothetical protein
MKLDSIAKGAQISRIEEGKVARVPTFVFRSDLRAAPLSASPAKLAEGRLNSVNTSNKTITGIAL